MSDSTMKLRGKLGFISLISAATSLFMHLPMLKKRNLITDPFPHKSILLPDEFPKTH